MSRLEQKI